MAKSLSIFDLIQRLTESLPLDPAKVSEILGTPLDRNPAGDTPVLMSHTQAAGIKDSPYKEVDLRVPDPLFGSGAGILGVTLQSDGDIDSKAVQEHFGYDYQRSVPSPRYPPEIPVYYTYEQPWGRLSLGVSNNEAAKLVSFVMEPTKV